MSDKVILTAKGLKNLHPEAQDWFEESTEASLLRSDTQRCTVSALDCLVLGGDMVVASRDINDPTDRFGAVDIGLMVRGRWGAGGILLSADDAIMMAKIMIIHAHKVKRALKSDGEDQS